MPGIIACLSKFEFVGGRTRQWSFRTSAIPGVAERADGDCAVKGLEARREARPGPLLVKEGSPHETEKSPANG